jgi:hypothetical protein
VRSGVLLGVREFRLVVGYGTVTAEGLRSVGGGAFMSHLSLLTANDKPQRGGALDLRALRAAAGLSQQRVAELSGCSIAAVALYEKGYAPATPTVLPRILHTLNCERPVADTPGARTNSAMAGPTRGS